VGSLQPPTVIHWQGQLAPVGPVNSLDLTALKKEPPLACPFYFDSQVIHPSQETCFPYWTRTRAFERSCLSMTAELNIEWHLSPSKQEEKPPSLPATPIILTKQGPEHKTTGPPYLSHLRACSLHDKLFTPVKRLLVVIPSMKRHYSCEEFWLPVHDKARRPSTHEPYKAVRQTSSHLLFCRGNRDPTWLGSDL
jgi:hypothetical protein